MYDGFYVFHVTIISLIQFAGNLNGYPRDYMGKNLVGALRLQKKRYPAYNK
jgi:hypothetical protein